MVIIFVIELAFNFLFLGVNLLIFRYFVKNSWEKFRLSVLPSTAKILQWRQYLIQASRVFLVRGSLLMDLLKLFLVRTNINGDRVKPSDDFSNFLSERRRS